MEESLSEAIHVVDHELRVVLFSPGFSEWCARLGLRVDAAASIGRPLTEVFPFLPREIFAQYRQVLATGRALQTDEVTSAGGRQIRTRTRKLPLVGAGGTAGVLTIVTDLSVPLPPEEAVLASEERYRKLFEGSTDAIFVADAETLRMLDCNLAAERLIERSRAEILTMTADQFHPPEVLARTMRRFADYARGMVDSGLDSELLTRTGKRVPVSINASRVRLADRACVIGIFRDNTARMRAEEERGRLLEQLQQAMKMEAIGRLAGGVAHDFNNLLTGIAGNVELALLDLDPAAPLALSLREALRATHSATTLTRQLLAFSRKQVIEPRVLDLNALVARLRPMIARLLGEDVRLRVVAQPDLGPVEIDPGVFEQVLANLAVNARDAMPAGGELTVETADVGLAPGEPPNEPCLPPGRYVRLRVRDTGHGMSPEVRARLFEPFFTTKPRGQGTGLGLATIFGAVSQAGGAIAVDSRPGQGATFDLLFPRSPGVPVPLPDEPADSQPPAGSETVLLVEDAELVRSYACEALGRLGYRVLVAADGAEALALARKTTGRIALLLTDVVMPGMNGRELAEGLRALHPETRVLFTSGYGEEVIAHHGVLDAALSFLPKPYSLQSLAVKIREVLER